MASDSHYAEDPSSFWGSGGVPVSTLDHPTERKCRSFLKLPAGWHFGEGIPPSMDTISRVLSFHDEAIPGFPLSDAFPGIGGEVMLAFYLKGHCLEFTFEPDGRLFFVQEENGVGIEGPIEINRHDALNRIAALREKQWRSSVFSVQGTMTVTGAASPAWPSRTRVGSVEYLSSGRTAFPSIRFPSAGTFALSIPA